MSDLIERLRRYRPRDEWGDPVNHTICDEAANALAARDEEMADIRRHLEFVAQWAWRKDPPNAARNLLDSERLSAIKHYPAIRSLGKEGSGE